MYVDMRGMISQGHDQPRDCLESEARGYQEVRLKWMAYGLQELDRANSGNLGLSEDSEVKAQAVERSLGDP